MDQNGVNTQTENQIGTNSGEREEIKQTKYWRIKTPACSSECVGLLSTKAELYVGSKV